MKIFLEEISLLWLGLILLGILLGWFIVKVTKSECSLNKRLEELENKANSAKSIEELENTSTELLELSNICFHDHHCTQLSMIKTIIQIKLDNYYAKKTQIEFDL